MKYFLFLVLFLFFLFPSFAQTDESDFSDLDYLFEDAQDVNSPVVNEKAQKVLKEAESSPLVFSGKLTSSLGAACENKNNDFDFTGYMELKNNFYIDVSKKDLYKIHADIYTVLPYSQTSSSNLLSLRELYFNSLILSRLYLTVGKKKINSGYPRLFSADTKDVTSSLDITGNGISSTSSMNTNILSDSLENTSVTLILPLNNLSFSALAFYPSYSQNLDSQNISCAFSFEFLLFNTSFNFFARKNLSKKSQAVLSGTVPYQPHVAGFEFKSSFLSFDFYAQELLKFISVKEFFKCNYDTLDSSVSTLGFYRIFDFKDFTFAFNAEYQCEYLFTENLSSDFMQRSFFEAGLLRLGKKNNISLGISNLHKYEALEGYAKFGINIAKVFAFADWQSGIKASYNFKEEDNKVQILFASWLKFTFNY